jgi:outer membrane protein assembly factor BamB
MVAMDIATGNPLWEQNIAGISTPWAAGEWLFVVTDDARLLCDRARQRQDPLDRPAAALQEREEAKNPISWEGPVLAGGRLVLAIRAARSSSVSPKDGSVTGTMDQGAISLSAGGREQHALRARRQGRLSAYRNLIPLPA